MACLSNTRYLVVLDKAVVASTVAGREDLRTEFKRTAAQIAA
jgi:hypothetical protein